MTVSDDLLITNVRPWGGEPCDLLVRGGRIVEMRVGIDPAGRRTEEARGKIAMPGLVDAHTHFDKSFIGLPWQPNVVEGGLPALIANDRGAKKRLALDAGRQSSLQVALSVARGTTAIRSHVDIDTENGLAALARCLESREKYAGLCDIELVAFPQSGLLKRAGTADLLDEAMASGADVVGGIDPCLMDMDPKGHLDVVFGLSQKHGKPIDIHLHEPGPLGAFSMRLIIERAKALGMRGTVAISHAFCLGDPDRDAVDALLDELAKAEIGLITTAPSCFPVPPFIRARRKGVRIAVGNDGIRDAFTPYGSGDMLERTMLLGLRNDLNRDDELRLALESSTLGGAELMALGDHGLNVGARADLVLLDAENLAEAIVAPGAERTVIKGGAVIVRGGALSPDVRYLFPSDMDGVTRSFGRRDQPRFNELEQA